MNIIYNIMDFICKTCNYETNSVNNWCQHKRTKKHKKLNNIELDLNKKFTCEKCSYSSDSKQGWYQHKKSKKHLSNINKKEKKNLQNNNLTQNAKIIINNNDNSVNNHIQINILGEENNILTFEAYKNLIQIKDPIKALDYLMDILYIKKKENNNVLYTNLRSNKCKVLTNSGYTIMNTDRVFEIKAEKVTEVKLPENIMNRYLPITLEISDALNDYYEKIPNKPNKKNNYNYKKEMEIYKKKKENQKDINIVKASFFNEIYNLKNNNI